MRGKGYLLAFSVQRFGITPAHAGKSPVLSFATSAPWDHPRPCGEKPTSAIVDPSTRGSPPPMRGKVVGYARTVEITGITPAHAGKRGRCARCCGDKKDHPRPCGEKQREIAFGNEIMGSPPPMRGKGEGRHPLWSGVGITPAHAGKSRIWGAISV